MQKITERLQLLPPDYVTFVTSDFSRVVTQAIARQFQLQPTQSRAVENGVLYFLLLYFTKKDFVEYLEQSVGIPAENAQLIAATFFDILPLSFPWEAISQVSEGETFSVPEIQELENLRTMATDMQSHQAEDGVYRSSQDTLLQRSNQNDDRPRWESDTST